MWHASVALIDAVRGLPIPIKRLFSARRRYLEEIAQEMLLGVGASTQKLEHKEVAVHFRRSLAAIEIEQLPPEWLAIPAVDMA